MPARRWLAVALLSGAALAGDEAEFGFLDYLGEMVEAGGEWVDPVALDEQETAAPAVELPTGETQSVPEAGEDDE